MVRIATVHLEYKLKLKADDTQNQNRQGMQKVDYSRSLALSSCCLFREPPLA